MKGKKSRETASVAKVILRKNRPGNALPLAYTRGFRLTGVGVPAKWLVMLAPIGIVLYLGILPTQVMTWASASIGTIF